MYVLRLGPVQRRPTYADHGLDFRMKRDAHMGDQGHSRISLSD